MSLDIVIEESSFLRQKRVTQGGRERRPRDSPFILNGRKRKPFYNDRKQISGCLRMGSRDRQAGAMAREGMRKHWGAMHIFTILIMVTVARVDAYVKTYQIV